MFVLVRTLLYTALFVGVFFVQIPGSVLAASGVDLSPAIGLAQAAGAAVAFGGVILVAWATLALLLQGEGTPAPWDPPHELVSGGPYRLLRNPMYLGGSVALIGGALFYQLVSLLAYAAVFFFLSHCIVKGVEEPALRRRFPHRYPVYWATVNRWRIPLPSALTGRRRRGTTASASR